MNRSLKIGDTLWLHAEGRTFTISLKPDEQSRATKKGGPTSSSGLLKSPMPGKVLKVNFKAGDSLTQGQTVCVIEAMKMEYALKAPFNGKIKAINKKSGDQVIVDEPVADIQREHHES